MKKKLHKSNKNKMIGGVCGGIAEYFNIDPTIVRILAVILAMVNGIGFLAYLIILIIMPKDDGSETEYNDDDVEKMKSANINPDEGAKSSSESGAKNEGGHSDSDFDSYFKK